MKMLFAFVDGCSTKPLPLPLPAQHRSAYHGLTVHSQWACTQQCCLRFVMYIYMSARAHKYVTTSAASAELAEFWPSSPQIKSPDTKSSVVCRIKSSRSIPKSAGCSGAPLTHRRDWGCAAQNKAVKQHRETTLSLRAPSVRFKEEGKSAEIKGLGALLNFKKRWPGPVGTDLAAYDFAVFFFSFFFRKNTKAGQGFE